MDEGGPFTGGTGDMLSKARKWMSISVGIPPLGNMEGHFFLGAFLLEEFLLGPSRDVQMPCRRVSLSIGASLDLKGVRLLGLLREKKYYIWVPFLDQEVITILSLGVTAHMIRHGAQRCRLLNFWTGNYFF